MRQLEENNHSITFYVLTEIHDQSHISLDDKNSAWSLYLECANGQKLAPKSIKEVDYEPAIRFLFGHRHSLLKKSYRVEFAARDLAGEAHLIPGERFTMVCAGSGISKSVSWCVPFCSANLCCKRTHLKTKIVADYSQHLLNFHDQNNVTTIFIGNHF